MKTINCDINAAKYAVFVYHPSYAAQDIYVAVDRDELPKIWRLNLNYSNSPEGVPENETAEMSVLNLNQNGEYSMVFPQKYSVPVRELHFTAHALREGKVKLAV